ncbi:MAG: hypothetical protein HYX32_02855 [Actinobacteria bacterium]|nr:hypothetical protein [Actinomycetota bacterium]
MTDALTDSSADGANPGATIAPPAGPDVDENGAQILEPAGAPAPSGAAAAGIGIEPEPPSFGARVGRWFRATGDRLLAAQPESYVSLLVVGFCVVFVFMQLGPSLILANNTPAGGDMGAHVWGPAFMRDNLLPKGRLTGWTPDWYAGFPAYEFYMVLPSLVIALLSYLIPYGVAFKLVAVSGVVSMPIAAWACAKLSDLPFPAPPLFAVAGTVFLFDRSFSIYGGNIPSTLAGEFAFSISLSFALLFLGVFTRALRSGSRKYRGWAAILLALSALSHLIPFIFAMVGAGLIIVLMPGLNRRAFGRIAGLLGLGVAGGLYYLANPNKGITAPFGFLDFVVSPGEGMRAVLTVLAIVVVLASIAVLTYTMVSAARHVLFIAAPVIAVGGLLSAWWTVPFYLNSKYMNDMGWERKDDVQNMLFQRAKLDPQLVDSPPIKWLLIMGAAGALLSLIWWRRGGIFWLLTAVTFGLLFVYMPEGRLWNARLLPFYYLALYFLAAVGIAEVSRLIATLFARDVNRPIRTIMNVTAVAGLSALIVVAFPLRTMPFGSVNPDGTYQWLWWKTTDSSFINSWAAWNFTGYEGKPAYPEYRGIVSTMNDLGQSNGCGRAMWEHEEQHDRYGTPMALMLLPFWTNGCIGSMEGLYFEASSTTPYHFINQDELSRNPSNAQRDLPYGPGAPTKADFDLGIEHLKMLGVRYYMAISEGPGGMIDLGRQNKNLREVATSGPWVVFEITNGNALVEPLKYEPAVVKLNDPKQPLPQDLQGVKNPDGSDKVKTGSPWQFTAMDWYQDPKAWDTYLTEKGPDSWQRVDRGQQPKLQAEKPITVSNISTTDDTISFDVSEPGVPVLVKTSYFPNWKASGAEGPWRATPNLMIVVPTSNRVELRYGYTGVDYLSWLLTLLGVAGLFWLFRGRAITAPDPGDPNELVYEPGAPGPLSESGPHYVFDPHRGTFVPVPRPPPGTAPPERVGWGVTVPLAGSSVPAAPEAAADDAGLTAGAGVEAALRDDSVEPDASTWAPPGDAVRPDEVGASAGERPEQATRRATQQGSDPATDRPTDRATDRDG